MAASHSAVSVQSFCLDPGLAWGPVRLIVVDRARVIAFYSHIVGLELQDESDGIARLGAPGGPTLLELVEKPDARPAGASAPGLFHLAIRLPSRAALGAWLGAMIRQGVRLDGASDHGVSEAIYVSDPEGNGVEIYADAPRSDWPLAPNGHVAMTTERLDAAGTLAAGSHLTWQGVPEGTDLGHVHLKVSSLDQARAFYVDLLGLRVRQENYHGALFLAAGDYHHHLGLNIWHSRGAAPAPAGSAGLAELTLRLAPNDFERVKDSLSGRWPVTQAGNTLRLSGPDGLPLILLPRS